MISDGSKIMKLLFFVKTMIIINLKDFMKKYNLEDNNMKESKLQKVYDYPIHPRDSKFFSDKALEQLMIFMLLQKHMLINFTVIMKGTEDFWD